MPTDRNLYMREYMRLRRANLKSSNVNHANSTPSVAAPTPSVAAPTPSVTAPTPSVAAHNEPTSITISGWWLLAGVLGVGVLIVVATRMTPDDKVKWLYTLVSGMHTITSAMDDTHTNDEA